MPKIITWDREYDFTLKIDNVIYYAYLKENLLVKHKWQKSGIADEYLKQEAIVEHPTFGLAVWYEKESHWIQIRKEILEAYSNYIAEKEILKSGDNE